MISDVLRTVKLYACFYWDIKRAISEKRARMAAHRKEIGGVQKNKISDPTAAQAIRNMTPIDSVLVRGLGVVYSPELWMKAIEEGFEACSDDVKAVARSGLFGKKSVVYVSMHQNIDPKTVYKKRAEAVTAMAVAAAKHGLVDVDGGTRKN